MTDNATVTSPALAAADGLVSVAVFVPLRRLFTYRLPPGLRGVVRPGHRVAVPFGRRNQFGIVIGEAEASAEVKKVKDILGLVGVEPVFEPELLRFLVEAARYYMHPLGEVLRAAAPAMPKEAIEALRKQGSLTAQEAARGAQLRTRRAVFVAPTELATEATIEGLRGESQRAVLSLLAAQGEMSIEALRRHVKRASPVAKGLAEKGLVSLEERVVADNPFFASAIARDVGPTPNAEQASAIEAVVAALGQGGGFLLQGVTGSGKTEVYLRIIEAARGRDLGALVLVPEIALTPQLVSRFRARFGDDIAVLHSELSERSRDDAWRSLREGRVRIAIGARSALFSPVQGLGVVVVDEEHDSSFKQEEGFRYQARDMALYRAHLAGAVCVLGSATPSLESLQLAHNERLSHLRLTARATSQSLPDVEVVDLGRHRSGPSGHRLLSAPLYRGLEQCLSDNGQAILFLNRRGFAPALRCDGCGEIQECPACSVAMTAHHGAGHIRCHYCGFFRSLRSPCGSCGGGKLLELGLGTEQLESLLEQSFPEARVARLDRDTAAQRGVESVLDQLRRREVDILVGTQMVTKGHDLPGVTLVGVVLADQSLAFPDFRAAERTFQLLAQVAGRAGRGDQPGRVVLQTYQPELPAVRFATRHDYDGFAAAELADRRSTGYPPSARMAAVRVDGPSESRADGAIRELAGVAEAHAAVRSKRAEILGPAPAPIAKIRARYRFRLLLRAKDRASLRAVASAIVDRIDAGLPGIRASVDIDPVNML